MSDTVIVKAYSSGAAPELRAVVPVREEDVAPPDEGLVQLAKLQLTERLPAGEIEGFCFKIERGLKPARTSTTDERDDRVDHVRREGRQR